MEGIELIEKMASELHEGRMLVEAVVLSSFGSVARPAGARMLLLADGEFEGTVGGGAPELHCQKLSQTTLEDGETRHVTLSEKTIGMICGGTQKVGIRRLSGADLPALDAALKTFHGGKLGSLICDWSLDNPAFEFIPACQGTKCALEPSYKDGVYAEPIRPRERAVIFGGGHVGRALVPALASMGFAVVVFDNRPDVARVENFPDAARVIYGDYANIAESLTLRSSDYVCVMTHGHVADETVVSQILSIPFSYLGCIGSRRKRATLLKVLESKGYTAEQADRVELPIGLELGAVTPAEIAISIAARIIQVRSNLRST